MYPPPGGSELIFPSRNCYASKPVRFIIGPCDEEFFIHAELLISQSTYFKSILNPDPQKRGKNALEFTDIHPNIFKKVAGWFYTKDAGNLCARDLVDVYIFGDNFGIRNLRNDMIDRYLESACLEKGTMASSLLRYVDENTTTPQLKNAIIAVMAHSCKPQRIQQLSPEKLSEYFTMSLLATVLVETLKISQARESDDVATRPTLTRLYEDRCRFHDHGEGEPRCKDKIEEVKNVLIRDEESDNEALASAAQPGG